MIDSDKYADEHNALHNAFKECVNLSGKVSLYTNTPKTDSYWGIFNGCIEKFDIYVYNTARNNTTNKDINTICGLDKITDDESWVTISTLSDDTNYNYMYIYNNVSLYPFNLGTYETGNYNWQMKSLS